MSDTPTITQTINRDALRKGTIPSPEGVMPLRRRSRRGLVSLAEWDQRVAQYNAEHGLKSESAPQDHLGIQPNTNLPEPAPEAILPAELMPKPAPEPQPEQEPRESRGAILEDDAPEPGPTDIAPEPDPVIPPPPTSKRRSKAK